MRSHTSDERCLGSWDQAKHPTSMSEEGRNLGPIYVGCIHTYKYMHLPVYKNVCIYIYIHV